MKIQKLKFVRNTAPDNQGVFNFLGNPDCMAHILVCLTFLHRYRCEMGNGFTKEIFH